MLWLLLFFAFLQPDSNASAPAQDAAQSASAQEQKATPVTDDPVFFVNVQLVQVDVQVFAKKTGRSVGSLSKEDFELYEDGARQQVTEISRDQLPLSVVLLFDLTDSVRPVLKPLAAGAL